MLAFTIFDPKSMPSDTSEFCSYGKDLLQILMEHYEKYIPAETLEEKFVKDIFVTSYAKSE